MKWTTSCGDSGEEIIGIPLVNEDSPLFGDYFLILTFFLLEMSKIKHHWECDCKIYLQLFTDLTLCHPYKLKPDFIKGQTPCKEFISFGCVRFLILLKLHPNFLAMWITCFLVLLLSVFIISHSYIHLFIFFVIFFIVKRL